MGSELEPIHDCFEYNWIARQAYFDALGKSPAEELQHNLRAPLPALLDIPGYSIGGVETRIVRMSALNGDRSISAI